jgi:queuosine precursor transporter
MTNYKFLNNLTIFYICFQLISDVTATKLIGLWSFPVSVTVLYFPITYILADILTEVYGFKIASQVLLKVLFCSVLSGLIYQIVVFLPSVQGTNLDSSFATVLGSVPRVLVGGWLAIYFGGIVNNYLLSKIKTFTKEKFLWIRTIVSTVFGELVNTFIFFIIGLGGVIPNNLILISIVSSWLFKVAVEIIFTPITYYIISYIKKHEISLE